MLSYPNHRYYGGCEYVEKIELLATERAKTLFGAHYANVQPHSGSQANTTSPGSNQPYKPRHWLYLEGLH